MTILVIAEHDNRKLAPATFNVLGAAQRLGGDIDLLVAGEGCAAVATEAARIAGVRRVRLADAASFRDGLAESLSKLVVSIAEPYGHILASATSFGKNLMPRIAALLDVAQVSDICAVESADTFQRPIYAGSLIATVRSKDRVKVVTVRPTSFAAAGFGGSAVIEAVGVSAEAFSTRWVSRSLTESVRPELGGARVVVSGGRGLGSAENFERVLTPLADALGAAIGASRAAVDAGFAPNDFQVGQTGKVVAPELYFAVGISGAIQHLAGMKDSKVIVAINKDPDAPIFAVADFGLEGDLFDIVPRLTAALGARR